MGRKANKGKAMKKWLGLLLGAAVVFGAAATPAGALPFNGTTGIGIGALGVIPFPGSGSGGSAQDEITVPANVFAGMVTVPVTGNAPITAIQVVVNGNGAATFTGALPSGPVSGQMAVNGAANILGSLGSGSFVLVAVPLFTTHAVGSAAGNPIGLGVGGLISITGLQGGGGYLRVENTDWTEGMVTVTGLPIMSTFTTNVHVKGSANSPMMVTNTYYTGTGMYTGTDSRTPGGLGQVTLVSPSRVTTNIAGGTLILVTFGKLTLNFVPEPGTLLLLGSGVAGLAILGRRRMRN
jgi:hypothetical protein